MSDIKWKNSKGELTPYALACGYEQQCGSFNLDHSLALRVVLWADGNCIHVRLHDHRPDGVGRVFWRSYDGARKLPEARAKYRETAELVRSHHAGIAALSALIQLEE